MHQAPVFTEAPTLRVGWGGWRAEGRMRGAFWFVGAWLRETLGKQPCPPRGAWGYPPVAPRFVRYRPAVNPAPLHTTLAGIPLASPIVLAAGTCGVLDEMGEVLDLSRIGAVVTKSITPLPREGNPTWRMIPAGPAGMLNAVGLANPGLDAFLEHFAPRAAAMKCKVFASVAGFSVDDYVQVAANLDAFSREHAGCFPALELNLSCPNVHAGVEFGASPAACREVTSAVLARVTIAKVFVKLGPLTPDLPAVARAAVSAGAAGVTLTNTLPAMAIDVEARRPILANTTGGLSGPALHPAVVKMVYDAARALRTDHPHAAILGLGGVMHWRDAAEFILAGASAVQVGTGLFVNPRLPYKLNRGLERWVRRHGRGSIREFVGALEPARPASDDAGAGA